jgi:Protein of unknown function (DUF3467)
VAEQQRDEKQASHSEESQGMEIKFQPDHRATFPTFYANFASVSHTGEDLSIDFCLLVPPYNVQPETQSIPVPIVVRVITPPGMAEGLIEALRIQLAKQNSERESGRMIIPVPGEKVDPHDKS